MDTHKNRSQKSWESAEAQSTEYKKGHMTNWEYEEYRLYALYQGSKYGLTRQDCEDVWHEVACRILEDNIPKSDWKKMVMSEIGNTYTKIKRRKEQPHNFDEEPI